VSAFELLGQTEVDGYLDLTVRVECSSGTYIRALARDLGSALQVGGHLTSLRRTRIGPFSIDAARPLDDLDVQTALIPPADAATRLFPRLDLSPAQAVDLGHGKRISADEATSADEASSTLPSGPVAAIAPNGHLVGLVEWRGNQARSIVNFPPDDVVVTEEATR
jgi:tRNA pseudouridine55 synthase